MSDAPYSKSCSQLQRENETLFLEMFGRTSLTARLDDLLKEAFEVKNFSDFKSLREELGDLSASVLAACSELDLDFQDLVEDAHRKIRRREAQYKSLGRKLNVALLGGSFDPIHNGHIAVAKAVLSATGQFDEVWLVPCQTSLHGKELSAEKHRLEMCRLAITDPRIRVFDYEIEHSLTGSTYHFLNRLLNDDDYKDKYSFSFIIGLDNALHAHEWVQWSDLERLVQFVVLPRAGQVASSASAWFMKAPHIFLVNEAIQEISSSQIRSGLLENSADNVRNYVSSQVLKYIHRHNLYSGETT